MDKYSIKPRQNQKFLKWIGSISIILIIIFFTWSIYYNAIWQNSNIFIILIEIFVNLFLLYEFVFILNYKIVFSKDRFVTRNILRKHTTHLFSELNKTGYISIWGLKRYDLSLTLLKNNKTIKLKYIDKKLVDMMSELGFHITGKELLDS